MRLRREGTICLAALLAAVLVCPSAASAEDPEPQSRPQRSQQTPDFLFAQPRGSVSIRGGWLFPSAGGDWFDFVTEQFTIDRNDFRSADLAAEVGIAVRPRLDVVIGADWTAKTAHSEYRDFVDNNRLPITQMTRLRHGAFTGGIRYTLTDRGRAVGTLAYLPNRFVPFVGGGAGVLWYELMQQGDFIDVADFSVFADFFEQRGARPVAYVNGGLDVHVYRALFVTLDSRYQWADAELRDPFIGFEPLDLGGLKLSAGINIVF